MQQQRRQYVTASVK